MLKNIFIGLNWIRLWPHWLVFRGIGNSSKITMDLRRWGMILRPARKVNAWMFVDIMTFFPEFRNLFYARVKVHHRLLPHFLKFLAAPQPLLNISAANIGGGLYIQHGFGTIIDPAKIGENCWVNQGVTIGYTNEHDCPIIGDDVTIGAGAKVLGNCTIGNRVVIGANAVVVKDVPDDCVVIGIPARIIRRNGLRVDEEL